jgi:hypothetical protein
MLLEERRTLTLVGFGDVVHVGKLLGRVQASGRDGHDLVGRLVLKGRESIDEVLADLAGTSDAPFGRHFRSKRFDFFSKEQTIAVKKQTVFFPAAGFLYYVNNILRSDKN